MSRLRRDVLLVVNELYLQGILNVRKESVGTGISIAFRKRTDEQIVPISKFLDVDDLGRSVQQTFISGTNETMIQSRLRRKLLFRFFPRT